MRFYIQQFAIFSSIFVIAELYKNLKNFYTDQFIWNGITYILSKNSVIHNISRYWYINKLH